MLMWCNAQPKYKVCVVFAEGQRRWQDPHHLRFALPRALGLKVSDEFTVPLCRDHHRQLHQAGNEVAWWHDFSIKPLEIAKQLWNESRLKPVPTATNVSRRALPMDPREESPRPDVRKLPNDTN